MPPLKPDHRHTLSLELREVSCSRTRWFVHFLTAGLFFIGLSPAASMAAEAYAVQVGAFANPENAARLNDRLMSAGFTATIVPAVQNTDRLTRVVVGPFLDKTTAITARRQLAANSWQGYIRSYPVTSDSTAPGFGKPSAKMQPGVHEHTVHTDLDSNNLLVTETPLAESAPDDDILIFGAPSAGSEQDILIIAGEKDSTMLHDEPADGTTKGSAKKIRAGQHATEMSSADSATWTDHLRFSEGEFSIGLDKIWLEYGNFYRSQSTADASNYGHLALSAEWHPDPAWEMRLGGRVDWYRQTGDPDVNDVELDYGDSFVRYRGGNYRITAGTQKIIWGRIDELPPTDRISRVDLARGILDDLTERRRAMPVVRLETFHEGYKLDAVWLPDFRKANLPDKDSVWYPVNRKDGAILGFESSPALKTFVRQGSFSESAPGDHGNFGLRLSNTGAHIDYATTVQHARQSTPYWQLNPAVRSSFLAGNDPVTAINSSNGATFKARYPRSWVVGGDMGFEALSATWRFEAAWISDTPVTRKDLRYDTVNSVNWAAGVQFYPGDSDVRVNLQLAAINLIDAPDVLDRENIYNFNGTVFGEFGNNRWQSSTRFFIGLDEKDIYLNPEIAFIGWEPHEVYAGWHYFNGNDQTIGGYWKDSSLLTLGWRSRL